MIKKMTWGDKVLFLFLLITTIVLFIVAFRGVKAGSMVLIRVDNREFGRFPLQTERLIHVKGLLGITDVEIKDGQVGIVRSPCPNKMCVRFGWISHVGRVGVCLPNKVVIRITGDEHSLVDAVTG